MASPTAITITTDATITITTTTTTTDAEKYLPADLPTPLFQRLLSY
jgi:hypothetical protein